MHVNSLPRRNGDTRKVRPNSGCQRYAIVANRTPYAECRSLASFAAKDEHMTAERIGAYDLLHLRRQTVEPGAQIDRLAGEKDLVPAGRAIIRTPAAPIAPAAAPSR
jgi:hypothetical protein